MKKNHSHKKRKKSHSILSFFGQLIGLCLIMIVLSVTALFSINLLMMLSTSNNMWQTKDLHHTQADYILVLGAGIQEDGEPSPILKERLDTAITLYQNKASDTILVSGGSDDTESEVSVMRNYLEKNDIPYKAIQGDSKGIDTFASINNAYDDFGAETLIIVSQKFHLYRAVFISEQLGVSTYGCPCDAKVFHDSALMTREFFARIKDFCQLFLPYLPTPFSDVGRTIYEQVSTMIRQ